MLFVEFSKNKKAES